MSAHIRWGEHLRGEEYRVVPGCGRGLRRGVGGGLAGDVEAVGTAMGAARKAVRRRAWDLAGESAPTAGISAAFPSVIDIDATLVDVHLREGGCGADRQEGVRLPPPDRLDRPRVWWWGVSGR